MRFRLAYRKHFLAAEFVLAVALTVAFALWLALCDGMNFLEPVLCERRTALYGTLAALFGSLLGFVLASVAIVLSLHDNEKLSLIRNSRHYGALWQIFKASMRALASATVVSLAALLLDRQSTPNPLVLVLLFGAVTLSALRLARVVWALEGLISVVATRRDG